MKTIKSFGIAVLSGWLAIEKYNMGQQNWAACLAAFATVWLIIGIIELWKNEEI